jgi:hypothetical protein
VGGVHVQSTHETKEHAYLLLKQNEGRKSNKQQSKINNLGDGKMNKYDEKIAKCKAIKNPTVVRKLVGYILAGIRKQVPTSAMAARLNECNIKPLCAAAWNAQNLQMQILKMARLNKSNSLARMLASMLDAGEVAPSDFELLQGRIR